MKTLFYALGTAAAAFLVSCKDREVLTGPHLPGARSQSVAQAVTGSKLDRRGEARFLAMAQAEPATAGFYLDSSGALVVWVKDSTKFDHARAEASGLLGSLAPTSSLRRAVRSIRLRKADFSFQQLSDWRDSVFVHLLGAVPGVNMDDFDEATNRVVIGLTKDAARAQVLDSMVKYGIPLLAVRFETTTPQIPQRDRPSATESQLTHWLADITLIFTIMPVTHFYARRAWSSATQGVMA